MQKQLLLLLLDILSCAGFQSFLGLSVTVLGRSEDQLEMECPWTCVTSGGQEADEFMRLAATCAEAQLHTATKRTKYRLQLHKHNQRGFMRLCVCVFVCGFLSSGQERSVQG